MTASKRNAPYSKQTPTPFTVVVLSGTRSPISERLDILEAQIDWITAERERRTIALVVHPGDIVGRNEPSQWACAAHALRRLDGVAPYAVSTGNRDYGKLGDLIGRSSLISEYFPASVAEQGSRHRGFFERGRVDNSFAVIDVPGGQWLVLALEFGPRDEVLAWANQIARRFSSLPTIVVTHAHLAPDGTRYDHLSFPAQRGNPRHYFCDALPGDINDGEEIWHKLVATNDNIHFVLCGHAGGSGLGRLKSVRPDGATVHQILTRDDRDEGFLRLMRFSPPDRRVTVRTYSPYLNTYISDADNEFNLHY